VGGRGFGARKTNGAPELIFINILWRAEILGFDCKTGYSAKPNQILIHKHFTRISARFFTTAVKSC
jgi:hypothetical protein